MIFVTLGTQDKGFVRLLEAIEKELKRGTIKEKVIVQAGHTKYTSEYMEIFDLMSSEDFEKYIDKADVVITHGGVGSILGAIKKGKPVIAAARLKKYKEHTNDHQKQIIKEFSEMGYILELRDFGKIGKLLEKAKSFKVKKFKSNTKNMVKLLENYIDEDDHISWYNKYKEVLLYLVFGGLTTLVNIISFFLLRLFNVEVYISNFIAWFISVLFAFVTNKLFVFESNNQTKRENIKELFSFFRFRILSLGIDMVSMWFLLQVVNMNELLTKITTNVIVIILNYIFSKLFIFKK